MLYYLLICIYLCFLLKIVETKRRNQIILASTLVIKEIALEVVFNIVVTK